MTEIISEDWLLEHLPQGWTYDCTFTPEPAFLIYGGEGGAAPRYGPFRLPLRLLADADISVPPEPRVEVYEWEQRPDGYLHKVRTKTIREVYDELREHLGEFPYGGEEYFDINNLGGVRNMEWPEGDIVCFSVNGSSEGDYTHVEVHGDGVRQLLFLGKTFSGRDASWAFARRLADMLEVQ